MARKTRTITVILTCKRHQGVNDLRVLFLISFEKNSDSHMYKKFLVYCLLSSWDKLLTESTYFVSRNAFPTAGNLIIQVDM